MSAASYIFFSVLFSDLCILRYMHKIKLGENMTWMQGQQAQSSKGQEEKPSG
jgi:hypothetical protein